MIKIYIFADSYKHFDDAIKEYTKRLWRKAKVIKLPPSKKQTPKDIIDDETLNLKEKISKEKGFKVLLNPSWKELNTFEFVNLIEETKHNYPDIVFAIGWAYGFDYAKLKNSFNLDLSLWKFIMPHALVLTIVLEQVYRADMIERWGDYHK